MEHVQLGPDMDEGAVSALQSELEGLATVGTDGPPPTFFVSGQPPGQLVDLGRLRSLIVPFAGVPMSVRTFAADHPNVQIYNLHFNAQATAEMAVGLLIASARNLVVADRMLREGVWRGRQTEDSNVNLAGKHAVIFGFGAVGQCVAATLSALGMTYDGVGRDDSGVEALLARLSRAHALVVTAPLTEETRGRIGRAELMALRQPSLVVNVGRGDVVEEEALFDLLKSGEIRGAGIDVWYRYPTTDSEGPVWPSQFPFQELDNVVMSPHRGGNGDETEPNRIASLAVLLKRLLAGEAVRPVDPRLGY